MRLAFKPQKEFDFADGGLGHYATFQPWSWSSLRMCQPWSWSSLWSSWKTTALLRYMQAPVQAGRMRKEQSCGPVLAMPGSSPGHSKEADKAPRESLQNPVLLQGSDFALSHQAVGDPSARAIALPRAGGNSNSHEQHHKLKFSCPNPSFLETQCSRCSAIVVPLMPHLGVVCTVPCILLEHPVSLCPFPSVLLAPPQPALLSPPQAHLLPLPAPR